MSVVDRAAGERAPAWRLRPVPMSRVRLADRLWTMRQKAVIEGTVPYLYEESVRRGMLAALEVDRPPGPLTIPFAGRPTTAVMYWDSDLAKWLETACYALALRPDTELEARVDDLIARFARAQRADGYVNSYFLGREPDKIFTNLRDWHELYNLGHLIEAAVAHAEVTGKRTLVGIVERYLELVRTTFGTGPGQRRGYCGHPEIELALVRLYRLTGDRRHLELARYFVDERGRQPHYFDQEAAARGADTATYYHRTYEYSQSHRPLRQQHEVVGHAVRATYIYSAMAELAGEDGDQALRTALDRLWQHLTTRRLYVTGGVGPSAHNEGFTSDFDLPNDSAYAETCAAIGLVFWAQRMLALTGDGAFADVMELALHNGAAVGLSLGGDRFFYDNPLASRGDHHRWAWHRCICCPANIGRLVASLGGYVYGAGDDEIAVHLYVQSEAELEVAGARVTLTQTTDYPWDGLVTLTLEPERPVELALALRLPGWCRAPRLAVNGEPVDPAKAAQRGYARLQRRWRKGDRVTLELPMPVERLYAHPAVRADLGRVALRRGPLVYCAEGVDNEVPVERIALPPDAALEARFEPELMGGVVTVTGPAVAVDGEDWGADLYRTEPPARRGILLKAVPYACWDGRESGEMAVWLREARGVIRPARDA